jgi:hypothetical protein
MRGAFRLPFGSRAGFSVTGQKNDAPNVTMKVRSCSTE